VSGGLGLRRPLNPHAANRFQAERIGPDGRGAGIGHGAPVSDRETGQVGIGSVADVDGDHRKRAFRGSAWWSRLALLAKRRTRGKGKTVAFQRPARRFPKASAVGSLFRTLKLGRIRGVDSLGAEEAASAGRSSGFGLEHRAQKWTRFCGNTMRHDKKCESTVRNRRSASATRRATPVKSGHRIPLRTML
jgi:hypothetical protein